MFKSLICAYLYDSKFGTVMSRVLTVKIFVFATLKPLTKQERTYAENSYKLMV
jgi:hypothetical protein